MDQSWYKSTKCKVLLSFFDSIFIFGLENLIVWVLWTLDIVLTCHYWREEIICTLALVLHFLDECEWRIQALEATRWKSLAACQELEELWTFKDVKFSDETDEMLVLLTGPGVVVVWVDVLSQLFLVLPLGAGAWSAADDCFNFTVIAAWVNEWSERWDWEDGIESLLEGLNL